MNGDGLISPQELVDIANVHHEYAGAPIDALLAMTDEDHDGMISLPEFGAPPSALSRRRPAPAALRASGHAGGHLGVSAARAAMRTAAAKLGALLGEIDTLKRELVRAAPPAWIAVAHSWRAVMLPDVACVRAQGLETTSEMMSELHQLLAVIAELDAVSAPTAVRICAQGPPAARRRARAAWR